MANRKFVVKELLKDKKLWFASFLIVWAAALQVISISSMLEKEILVAQLIDY